MSAMLLTPGGGNNSQANHRSDKGNTSHVGNQPKGCKKYNYEFAECFFNKSDELNTCALDIGGTLIKVAYRSDHYISDECQPTRNTQYLTVKIKEDQLLCVHFFKINELNETLSFLMQNGLIRQKIFLTGGGAHKYFFNIIDHIVQHEVIVRGVVSTEEYPLLYVSNSYYCETSRTLSLELQIRENTLPDGNTTHEGVPFNKSLVDSFPACETVRVYLVHPNAEQKKGKGYVPTQIKREEANRANDEENNTQEKLFQGELILQCSRKDEMHCVMNGLYKLLNVKKSVVRYHLFLKAAVPVQVKLPYEPFIIANIGSGISILLSNGFNKYMRIGGTAIGGGTLMGLAQLILKKVSFEELIRLAAPLEGETTCSWSAHPPFDLTLRHIRKDAACTGAPPHGQHAVAASFGFLSNIVKTKNVEGTKSLGQAVARSLITMVSYNIGYLVHLLARIHGVRRIFFSGKYISNHECIIKSLTMGVYYYYMYCHTNEGAANDKLSGKRMEGGIRVKPSHQCSLFRRGERNCGEGARRDALPEVLFLKHDGFLGAIGCFFS
ncbi:pantothenate kinase [Plasmodium fragile]|uniref:Pantothenate kinase n=1 Tax=Plasmodium fragile TaxID=5857 RepID=A0A0D9QSK0_PLAFR|nr:pantothenate kinase [Plasmodium fragile]KJP89797.1 pantothenate kinase [Plasmodium fragile]